MSSYHRFCPSHSVPSIKGKGCGSMECLAYFPKFDSVFRTESPLFGFHEDRFRMGCPPGLLRNRLLARYLCTGRHNERTALEEHDPGPVVILLLLRLHGPPELSAPYVRHLVLLLERDSTASRILPGTAELEGEGAAVAYQRRDPAVKARLGEYIHRGSRRNDHPLLGIGRFPQLHTHRDGRAADARRERLVLVDDLPQAARRDAHPALPYPLVSSPLPPSAAPVVDPVPFRRLRLPLQCRPGDELGGDVHNNRRASVETIDPRDDHWDLHADARRDADRRHGASLEPSHKSLPVRQDDGRVCFVGHSHEHDHLVARDVDAAIQADAVQDGLVRDSPVLAIVGALLRIRGDAPRGGAQFLPSQPIRVPLGQAGIPPQFLYREGSAKLGIRASPAQVGTEGEGRYAGALDSYDAEADLALSPYFDGGVGGWPAITEPYPNVSAVRELIPHVMGGGDLKCDDAALFLLTLGLVVDAPEGQTLRQGLHLEGRQSIELHELFEGIIVHVLVRLGEMVLLLLPCRREGIRVEEDLIR
mmetsp:Transcript_133/g.263  ORF Transcript_133/g.263 Transcript_133/m.263 type:complete len:532 (+) Transcript_133:36-1631(+)